MKINSDPDPLFPNEWNITNTGQFNGTSGADMKVANAWSNGYTGAGIKVAVIDLGVDLNHPDLQANLLAGYDATGNNSGGAPTYDANNAHGTSCAGIIASAQNTIGGVGVAYNAKIIPIRLGIADANGHFAPTDSQISACFSYAININNGADVISCSWGGGSQSAQIDQAILNAVQTGRGGKGTIVLFAAGNNNSSLIYPASNPNVIAVGASSECDTRKRSSSNTALLNPGVSPDPLNTSCDGEYWWGSNFGTGLDIMAPGVHITTTTLPTGSDYSNAYVTDFNGTSSATPNTAAVVALMLSANPNLTGTQARNILETHVDKVGGYTYQSNVSGQPNGTWSSDAGYGRVNASNAACSALSALTTITGPSLICPNGTATFTLSNVPVGVTVTWTVTSNLSITSQSNSAATVYATGAGTVTAHIGCGAVSHSLQTGAAAIGTVTVSGSNHVCPGNQYGYTADTPGGYNSSYTYSWTYPSGWINQGQGANYINLYLPSYNTSYGYVNVTVSNCGSSSSSGLTAYPSGCSQGAAVVSYSYYPNPASNTLTVQVASDSTSTSTDTEEVPTTLDEPYQLSMYNSFSQPVYSTQSSSSRVQIPLEGIPSGVYYLNLHYKGAVLRKQVIIKR